MQFLGHYRYSKKNRNRLGAEPLFQYEMIAADGVINGGDALFARLREQWCTIGEAIILFSLQSLPSFLMENAIQYCSATQQRNANFTIAQLAVHSTRVYNTCTASAIVSLV